MARLIGIVKDVIAEGVNIPKEQVLYRGSTEGAYDMMYNHRYSMVYDSLRIENANGDEKLLRFHRMADRALVLEDITGSGDAIFDWYYNGYDEEPIYGYYMPEKDGTLLDVAIDDLYEYHHLVNSITSIDKEAMLEELISAQSSYYCNREYYE